jgi:hypothetical protein
MCVWCKITLLFPLLQMNFKMLDNFELREVDLNTYRYRYYFSNSSDSNFKTCLQMSVSIFS